MALSTPEVTDILSGQSAARVQSLALQNGATEGLVKAEWKTFWIAAGGAIFGAVATITVGVLGFLNKDRELDIKMVEVSLSILAGENDATKAEPAKRFALRALERFSGVDIPDSEFEVWVKGERIVLSPLVSLWGGEDSGWSKALPLILQGKAATPDIADPKNAPGPD
jgi:hypothetical protein